MIKAISTKNTIRVLLHIGFWIFIFALFMFLYGNRTGDYSQKLILQFRFAIFEIVYVYFVIYYLIPRLLLRKKFMLFFLIFIISLPFVLILEVFAMLLPGLGNVTVERIFLGLNSPSFYWLAFENLFVVFLASSIKLVGTWYNNQKEKSELENKNLKSELELLKSQINPHFLFNTLNNINSLVFIDQQKTYDTIIKLSEMLRYMIYDTKTEEVFLKDEINVLNNYIELQRIRFKNPEYVHFSVTGKVGSIKIAPMLFIPFVENAFKFCRKNIEDIPGIHISFDIGQGVLKFQIWNYIRKTEKQKDAGGIGIENVRKRLQLIYPEQHKLTIDDKDEKFTVNLTLQTAKHVEA